jgi:hypothetical protein
MTRSIDKRCQAIEKLGGYARADEHGIVFVRFTDTTAGDSAARLLNGLTDLTELEIDDAAWTDQGMTYLEGLRGLRCLSLCAPRVTQGGLASIGKLINLERLELPARRLTRTALRPLSGMASLQELGLAQCKLASGCLAPLAALSRLERLRLSGCTGVDGVLEGLKKLPVLQDLDLAVSDVSDTGLAHVANMQGLTDLDLAHAGQVTAAGLGCLHGHRKLRRLNLVGVRIAEERIQDLCDAVPDCTVDPLPESVDGAATAPPGSSICGTKVAGTRYAWLDRTGPRLYSEAQEVRRQTRRGGILRSTASWRGRSRSLGGFVA